MKNKYALTFILSAALISIIPFVKSQASEAEEAGEYKEAGPTPREDKLKCRSTQPNMGGLAEFAENGEKISNTILIGSAEDLYNKFKGKVPDEPLKLAINYFVNNKDKFKNQNYMSIADYSINSGKKRFFLLDLTSPDGKVVAQKVSHGGGQKSYDGDPNHDGILDRCVHKNGSRTNMTRPGFFVTEDLYQSSQSWPQALKGYNGLRLRGLEERNADALDSGVVMHEAKYNTDGEGTPMGRSYGCPAFAPGKAKDIFPKIKNGSMFYAHVPQCETGSASAATSSIQKPVNDNKAAPAKKKWFKW